jgi:hypothetical protein
MFDRQQQVRLWKARLISEPIIAKEPGGYKWALDSAAVLGGWNDDLCAGFEQIQLFLDKEIYGDGRQFAQESGSCAECFSGGSFEHFHEVRDGVQGEGEQVHWGEDFAKLPFCMDRGSRRGTVRFFP